MPLTQKHQTSNNCYQDFPEYYDIIYRRYFKSIPDFVQLVSSHTPKEGKILDLAAGTGEVSLPLIRANFDVTSLDLNVGMLEVLKAKAQKEKLPTNTVVQNILDLDQANQFDTVCIRQAINYLLGTEELKDGLIKIHAALKDGGAFIFNSTNYTPGQTYSLVDNKYEEEGNFYFVLEQNDFPSERLLQHNQFTTAWGKDFPVPIQFQDSNSFYMFTKDEFEECLKAVGFSKIEFLSSGLKPYDPTSKTIYGVAIK